MQQFTRRLDVAEAEPTMTNYVLLSEQQNCALNTKTKAVRLRIEAVKAEEARQKLKKWASLPNDVHDLSKIAWWHPILLFKRGTWWFDHFALGGAEGISALLRYSQLDADGNGQLDAEEEKVLEETSNQLVADVTGFLQNSGVIAALVLSIFIGYIWEIPDVDADFKDLVGNTGTDCLKVVFAGINALIVLTALQIIFSTIRLHSVVTYWLPKPAEKLTFLTEETSFSSLAVATTGLLAWSPISVTLGGALFQGPWVGLVVLILTLWFYVNYFRKSLCLDFRGVCMQHQLAREIFASQDK